MQDDVRDILPGYAPTSEKTPIDRLASDIHDLVCDVPEAAAYFRRMFDEARVLEHFPESFDVGAPDKDGYYGEPDGENEGLNPWQPGEDYCNEREERKPVPLPIKAAWLSVIHDVQLPSEEPVLDRNRDSAYFGHIRFFCTGQQWQPGTVHQMEVFLKTVTTDIRRAGQAGKAKAKSLKQSWTQPDLNKEIRNYKAHRATRYAELVDGVRKNLKGAKKAAREMFGRNAIARKLGVKSPNMVGKSPVWLAIAEDLKIPLHRERIRGSRRTGKTGRIGLDIAVEQASVAAAMVGGEAETIGKEATLAKIRKLATSGKKGHKKAAQALYDKYEAGGMNDSDVCETVETLLDSA